MRARQPNVALVALVGAFDATAPLAKARLDTDRSAKPLTYLVSERRADGHCGAPVVTGYRRAQAGNVRDLGCLSHMFDD